MLGAGSIKAQFGLNETVQLRRSENEQSQAGARETVALQGKINLKEADSEEPPSVGGGKYLGSPPQEVSSKSRFETDTGNSLPVRAVEAAQCAVSVRNSRKRPGPGEQEQMWMATNEGKSKPEGFEQGLRAPARMAGWKMGLRARRWGLLRGAIALTGEAHCVVPGTLARPSPIIQGVYSTGWGGLGNMAESRSRSRGPGSPLASKPLVFHATPTQVHRGGAGNISPGPPAYERGRSVQLELPLEGGVHSTGRAGLANLTMMSAPVHPPDTVVHHPGVYERRCREHVIVAFTEAWVRGDGTGTWVRGGVARARLDGASAAGVARMRLPQKEREQR
ncbi:hypothetical protein C8R43DRAFT_964075 [Mycena crocata]|nr:hypothetical protein C8R43DRAFT_964075 [Mycena crocata]